MENSEIAELFALYGKLLELHGENSFRAAHYLNAPFRFKKLSERLVDLSENEIINHPLINKSLASKIPEILHNGSFSDLDTIIANTPKGLIELLSIRGLGAKKVRELWTRLGIESPAELHYACKENRLITLKGFGEKTQENILKDLEFREMNLGKMLYAVIKPVAEELLLFFRQLEFIERAEFTGEYRRLCEVIGCLEFVLICNNTEELSTALKKYGLEFNKQTMGIWSFELKPKFQLILHFADNQNFASVWLKTSSTVEHLNELKNITENSKSEEEIYKQNGFHFIRPELREGLSEFVTAKDKEIPEAVQYNDLRGTIHNHTVWSDGRNTVEEMAQFCISQGWEYLAICDHSQTASYAGGLTPDRVLQQMEEIDKINIKLAPFKIFKGIESDILGDGSLDYTPEILEKFDLIVASVHSYLTMDLQKSMERLLTAIENPFTTILGHPTGRLLLGRKGYPIDHAKIIDACAANNVIIELNANPHRLDLDWRWIAYAVTKGVKISINPDAHNLKGLLDMQFGVNVARKANLQKDFVLNALPLNEFERFLKDLRQSKGL